MTPMLYAAAIAATALAGTTAWALLERHDAGRWRDKAAIESAAAESALAAARANAATADRERAVSADYQRIIAELGQRRPEVETRVAYVTREIYRASDAYSPLGASLRLAARRLWELDQTGPGAVRAGGAAEARGAAGDPAAAAGAGRRRPAVGQADIGAYAVACLGHVIKLEYQLQALDRAWDAAAAGRRSGAPSSP